MGDIATIWSPGDAAGGWVLVGSDLAGGSDLETAVLLSLFTDRRASADDVIPDGSGDPRGWWGNTGRARPLGSKLWLLERAKQIEETRLRARDYAAEALAWLVDVRVADDVAVEAAWQGQGYLALSVVISEPGGVAPIVFTYQWAWKTVS